VEDKKIIFDDYYYLLSGPKSSDIDDFVFHLNDIGIYNGTLKIPFPYTKNDAKFYLKQYENRKQEFGHPMNWQIRTIEGKIIGGISLHGHYGKISHKDEIGYWLGRTFWNKGIMTKALPAFAQLVADQLGIIRLEATIFDYNTSSIRVAEKCGFNYEGTLKKAYFKDGKYIDGKLYALVK